MLSFKEYWNLVENKHNNIKPYKPSYFRASILWGLIIYYFLLNSNIDTPPIDANTFINNIFNCTAFKDFYIITNDKKYNALIQSFINKSLPVSCNISIETYLSHKNIQPLYDTLMKKFSITGEYTTTTDLINNITSINDAKKYAIECDYIVNNSKYLKSFKKDYMINV